MLLGTSARAGTRIDSPQGNLGARKGMSTSLMNFSQEIGQHSRLAEENA